MRWTWALLFLLSACTFDIGRMRNPLNVQVSSYPVTVTAGESFNVLIDVFNIEVPLESNLLVPEDIAVEESVGGSFVVLQVTVMEEAEPGVKTIVLELRSGEQQTTVNLGFTVEPPVEPVEEAA